MINDNVKLPTCHDLAGGLKFFPPSSFTIHSHTSTSFFSRHKFLSCPIPSITGPDYVIRNKRELTELFKGNPGIKIYDLSGREITLKPIYFNLMRGIYLYEDKRSKKRGLIMLIK